MRIEVDEDLRRMATMTLREHRYDALSVLDQGMGGWRDIDLWKAAQVERHFLATGDKGFADIRQYAPGTHAGVLLLRPNEDGIRPVVDLLERVLGGYDLEDLSGSVTVVSARGVRLRCAR